MATSGPTGRGNAAALKIEVLQGGKLLFDKKGLQKIMMAGGREVAAQARLLIARKLGPKSKKVRVASMAGSAPNSITGLLRKSIVVKALARKRLGARIIDTAFYAKFLETGAKGGGGRKGSGAKRKKGVPAALSTGRVLLPRPFLSTAMNMKRSSIDMRVKAAVNEGVAWSPEKAVKLP
jgi:hypothetical protein